MKEYIVSARKYRPMTFDSVVGQTALTTTLKNAVKSGKLAHAYLFCGPRGVGKTTCARIFAKAINCEHPTADGEACNECESCKTFNEGRSLNILELDAASNNSVENIKALMEQTRIPPQVGRYKVFIIDEVHMLSTAAFNAFLKTLEEPPAHVIFILATTEKHKILPTILSRCQIYDFERMTVPNTIKHLKMVAEKEGIQYEEQALAVIAEKADGGMRDALSIFDQAASFCQGNITYQKVIEDLNVLDEDNYFQLVDLALKNDAADMMVLLNNLLAKGFDGGNLINGLAAHVRNVLMAKDPKTVSLLETSDEQRKRYTEQAQKAPTPFLYKALQIMNRCDVEYRQSSNKRLLVELTLIEVAQITQPEDKDVPASGRSPYRLKILFKNLRQVRTKAAPQVAAPKPQPVNAAAGSTAAAHTASAQAAATTAATPHATTHFNPKGIGVSFDSILHPRQPSYLRQEKVAEAAAAKENKDRDFTPEELDLQWVAMCNRMPKQYIGLAQRLKNMRPQITTYPNAELVVDNQIFLDEVNKLRGSIRATLAQLLHNNSIQLTTRLAEAGEAQKILSRKDVFDELRKNNPSIERLRQALDLELT
ncbi:DNA polymerase III subunit gamma/tau [Prevotella sp. AGR2160]|uniref:DNA polymerase III subunit gamma/tau n=1 Tax=Prevotella sp. AGR2160 TaxID=1280674 RepID=UPI00041A625A|nr:DNA polymerase III subunit gamma/tau [Prevotella sp. AGR2160]